MPNKRINQNTTLNFISTIRLFSVCVSTENDPSKAFMRKENRELLHSLTCMQIEKVFRTRPKPFSRPTYQFLTADELKSKFEGALRTTKRLLLMPPILQIDDDNIEVLGKDPEIQGYLVNKVIFTDTTVDAKDRERRVWIRQTNGVLETADQLTRRRMSQIYFPFAGRKMIVPRMFFGEHLERVLDEGKYEFLLDRCIVQFEPYEKDYHRVTSKAYQHIDKHNAFDVLRSTRHFGTMSFFLAWHQLIDNLIIDCIRRDYLRNAVEAICLMYNLNNIPYDQYILEQLKRYPKRDDEYLYRKMIANINNDASDVEFEIEKTVGKNADDLKADDICLQFLTEYIESTNVKKPNEVKAAIQTYRDKAEEKKRLLDGLQKAHGIN